MTIKHLVISGGGPSGIKALGALQQLEKNKFWNIDEIQTIYATSAGAIMGLLIALRFEWDVINDYIIKRPWHDTYHLSVNQIFEAYSKKGLFDEKVISIFYKPFFDSKDLSMKITMKEFYEYSKIEVHFFSLELNNFELIDISYKTHPDLELLRALHMTIALPLVISPVCIDDKCYVDAGMISNYPLNYCIKNNNCPFEEILGFRNSYENSEICNNIVNNESTILDYIMTFINKMISTLDTETKQPVIPNEVSYKTKHMSISFIKETASSSETRLELLNDGIKTAEDFLSLKREEEVKTNVETKDNE